MSGQYTDPVSGVQFEVDEASLTLDAANLELPGVGVRVYFSDATPVFECQCKARSFGDAVVDAFRNWWKHVADKHPKAFND